MASTATPNVHPIITHINVVVDDMKQAQSFYARLGFTQTIHPEPDRDYDGAKVGLRGEEVRRHGLILRHEEGGVGLRLVEYHTPVGKLNDSRPCDLGPGLNLQTDDIDALMA